MKPTAISLFSGIGGIDLAFSLAGFDVLAQVEIDPFCQKVLAKHAPSHWPNAVQFEDVKSVGRSNLPAADVIFGGFPCQDISIAGDGAGIAKGTRSGLWFEFARITGEVRPRFVFIENVPAITTNGGTIVISSLAALGYDAEWGIVGAATVGAPHRRDRWFCVAYTNSFRRQESGTIQHCASNIQWNVSPYQQTRPAVLYAALSSGETLAHASSSGRQKQHASTESNNTGHITRGDASTMGNSNCGRCEQQWQSVAPEREIQQFEWASGRGIKSGMGRIFDGVPGRLDGVGRIARFPVAPGQQPHEWERPRTVEPKSVKRRTNRLKALGNAVVPQVIIPFAEIIRELIQS